jgi:hypothetical protein
MKKLLIIIGIAAMALTAQAQDLKARFIAMPDSVLPLMTQVNREDCVDFLESQMAAKVKNRFGGQTEMTVLTPDFLHLNVTDYSTVEMKLLPVSDSTYVTCMVTTVLGPVADSHVRFFDSQWQELSAEQHLVMPVEDAFYQPTDTLTDEQVRLRSKADIYLVKAELSAEAPTVTFTFTTPQYMAKEDREALSPLLSQEPVVYEWKEGHFSRIRE